MERAVTKVQVHLSPSVKKEMFLMIKDEDLYITDFLQVYHSSKLKTYVATETATKGSNIDSIRKQIMDNDDKLAYFLETKDGTPFFSIKNQLQGGYQRLASAELLNIDESLKLDKLSEFLSQSVDENNQLLKELQKAEKSRISIQEDNNNLMDQLMSKTGSIENVKEDMAKRFLPILNSKKEKIKQLELKIQALENGEEDIEKDIRSSDGEEEEEEREEEESKTKGQKTKDVKQGNKKEPSQETKRKGSKVTKDEALESGKKKQKPIKVEEEEEEPARKVEVSKTMARKRALKEPSESVKNIKTSQEKEDLVLKNDDKMENKKEVKSKVEEATKSSSSEQNKVLISDEQLEEENKTLPAGWKAVRSQTRPGEITYVNLVDGKRYPRRPLQAATRTHMLPPLITEIPEKLKPKNQVKVTLSKSEKFIEDHL